MSKNICVQFKQVFELLNKRVAQNLQGIKKLPHLASKGFLGLTALFMMPRVFSAALTLEASLFWLTNCLISGPETI